MCLQIEKAESSFFVGLISSADKRAQYISELVVLGKYRFIQTRHKKANYSLRDINGKLYSHHLLTFQGPKNGNY